MKAARLGVAAASFASAFVLVLVACGTSATEAPDLDAGAVTPSEAGPSDAGDAAPARPDAAPVEDASSCLTLPGECDLVPQGCPRTAEGAVQECRLARLEDAGYGAACRPAAGGSSLGATTGDDQSQPCLPGLLRGRGVPRRRAAHGPLRAGLLPGPGCEVRLVSRASRAPATSC